MNLSGAIAFLVDEAPAVPGPEAFLAGLGAALVGDGVDLSGASLTIAVPHPIIASRSWMWRADDSGATGGGVTEALGFARAAPGQAARSWLRPLGPLHEETLVGGSLLAWAGRHVFTDDDVARLREAARFAAAPVAALAAKAAQAALLEAYLGRRSAARVQAGALKRGAGETIRAALLYADLRGFTALSETSEPAAVIAALDAWFDRIAGSVHAFGGEVLKFIGDGVLAIFPVSETAAGGSGAASCEAALRAIGAARAGMARLDAERAGQGLPALPFGAALHLGEILWGNIGAADRLDFTAIGPAVNLASRLEGLCRPLERSVLISGDFAAQVQAPLVALGDHQLRGIAAPCAVFTLPDA
jgi:adenylate cyclase